MDIICRKIPESLTCLELHYVHIDDETILWIALPAKLKRRGQFANLGHVVFTTISAAQHDSCAGCAWWSAKKIAEAKKEFVHLSDTLGVFLQWQEPDEYGRGYQHK